MLLSFNLKVTHSDIVTLLLSVALIFIFSYWGEKLENLWVCWGGVGMGVCRGGLNSSCSARWMFPPAIYIFTSLYSACLHRLYMPTDNWLLIYSLIEVQDNKCCLVVVCACVYMYICVAGGGGGKRTDSCWSHFQVPNLQWYIYTSLICVCIKSVWFTLQILYLCRSAHVGSETHVERHHMVWVEQLIVFFWAGGPLFDVKMGPPLTETNNVTIIGRPWIFFMCAGMEAGWGGAFLIVMQYDDLHLWMNINEREKQKGSLALGRTWQTLTFAFYSSSPINYAWVILQRFLSIHMCKWLRMPRIMSEPWKENFYLITWLFKLLPLRKSQLLSNFHCCLHLSSHPILKLRFLLQEVRHLLLRCVHELSAEQYDLFIVAVANMSVYSDMPFSP